MRKGFVDMKQKKSRIRRKEDQKKRLTWEQRMGYYTEVITTKEIKTKKIRKIQCNNTNYEHQTKGRYRRRTAIFSTDLSQDEIINEIEKEISLNKKPKKPKAITEESLQQKMKISISSHAIHLAKKYLLRGVEQSVLRNFFRKGIVKKSLKLVSISLKQIKKEKEDNKLKEAILFLLKESEGNITLSEMKDN